MAAIIFDLDGTLIDSAPDLAACANAVLEEAGGAALTLEQVRGFIGDGAAALVARAMAASGLGTDPGDHERLLARFMSLYEDAVTRTTLYPGAAEALDLLAASNHALGLCTNKPTRPTIRVLRHLGLERHFAAVICGDTLPQRKPDPATIDAVLERLATAPALYVGDSEVDARTARAAGLPFVLFTEGYRRGPAEAMRSDATFASHADLPALVAGLLDGK